MWLVCVARKARKLQVDWGERRKWGTNRKGQLKWSRAGVVREDAAGCRDGQGAEKRSVSTYCRTQMALGWEGRGRSLR